MTSNCFAICAILALTVIQGIAANKLAYTAKSTITDDPLYLSLGMGELFVLYEEIPGSGLVLANYDGQSGVLNADDIIETSMPYGTPAYLLKSVAGGEGWLQAPENHIVRIVEKTSANNWIVYDSYGNYGYVDGRNLEIMY